MDIQISLNLFQGSKLSFHHFDGGNNNVVVGKGYVGSPKLFFSVFFVSISDGKSQPWQYLIWLELSNIKL
jgi:hypothetical protein